MQMREFQIVADEPPEYQGTNTGPMPTELFLASLASCFTLAVAHAARKRGIELPGLSVHVRGTYDGLKFGRIEVVVHCTYPRNELEAFIERARAYCFVSNTLQHPPEIMYLAADSSLTPDGSPPPRD